jgi:bifunctional UDP-N-acetylglucosamine pyrophosphorylase/glucosamine-1-phosphate N-acetyltransferase
VTIDSGVSIGMDTVIGPFAQILGRTVIGENCVVGACSIVRDSRLGDMVEVAPFTLVLDSTVESGARVGPFARVRMESHVEREARVGNFVELKKTRLGAGAKSLHLAYLGDTEVGDEANIGAGTVTCNYDGLRKHRTKIGRGVFVGSNATLVAPVAIGDGGYIGAGSVVTENVPEDALALGRARQVNKPDWAKKRRGRK